MASLLVAGPKLAQTSRLRLSFRRPHRPEPSLAEDAETSPKQVTELLLWTEIGKQEARVSQGNVFFESSHQFQRNGNSMAVSIFKQATEELRPP